MVVRRGRAGLPNSFPPECPGSFGIAGTRTAEFCATHASEGMINVISKRCDFPGCSKHPSYGVAGSKKAEFCVAHAKEGMVDVCSKRCGHPGCIKRSSYGTPGSKKPQFCIHHALKGMIDVVSKRCAEGGCNKWPSYGIPGSKKAEFCAAHAKDGMVGVCNKVNYESVRVEHTGGGGEGMSRALHINAAVLCRFISSRLVRPFLSLSGAARIADNIPPPGLSSVHFGLTRRHHHPTPRRTAVVFKLSRGTQPRSVI